VIQNLANETQVVVMKADGTNNGAAAGTSALTTSALDTQNAEGVLIVYLLGTVTATGTGSIQLQHSDASGSDYSSIGSPVTYTDADTLKGITINVHRPLKRYLRAVNTRATANSVVTSMVATLYGLRNQPRALDATVAKRYGVISPSA
jgi:hypothetical protein